MHVFSFTKLVVLKVRDNNSQVLVYFRLFNHSRRFVNFSLESNLAFVSLDAKFGLLRGEHEFFFFNRFFTGIAAPYFAYRRTFTSCFRTLLCALQRVEITTPLAPRMDLVDINYSTFPVDIPALDTFVN